MAAVAPLDDKRFLRLTTPVRQNITTVTRDDARTTLEIVNLETGEDTLAGVVPENPGGQRVRHHAVQHQSAQMAVDCGGHHGVRDHAFRTERGFADADRNRYAADDRTRARAAS